MDQSELEANTCNRCQAREKACERDTIGFGSRWLRKWREFGNQSQSAVKQNQNKHEIAHLRVAVNLVMKARLGAQLFI